MTPFEMSSIAFLVVSGIFATIGWLLNRLLMHQKQLNIDKEIHRKELFSEKEKTAETKFEQLIQRMDNLVEQLSHLFRDQEIVNTSISNLGVRVGKVEKRIGEHFIRCNEREKVITNIQSLQKSSIVKYDKALVTRKGSPDYSDRMDRDN